MRPCSFGDGVSLYEVRDRSVAARCPKFPKHYKKLQDAAYGIAVKTRAVEVGVLGFMGTKAQKEDFRGKVV